MELSLRIATRRSRLALWQAGHVADRLRTAHPGLAVELVPIVTEGDRILDRSLAAIGGKGLFIKELEQALLAGAADLAVHSMKDVPAVLPDGFALGAVLERGNAHDAFVSERHASLAALPPGARVGTSSLRRQSQLLHQRPDLEIRPLRGNVETRLGRLASDRLDAIVLAAAGLERLGLAARIREQLDTGPFIPAVGQAVIGIECRAKDARVLALLAPLEHSPTRQRLAAERACAARLGGSCQSPIAVHATLQDDWLLLRGFVGSPDGAQAIVGDTQGAASAAAALGTRLAEQLLEAGAGTLLGIPRAGAGD